jgi:hypothetical protein
MVNKYFPPELDTSFKVWKIHKQPNTSKDENNNHESKNTHKIKLVLMHFHSPSL